MSVYKHISTQERAVPSTEEPVTVEAPQIAPTEAPVEVEKAEESPAVHEAPVEIEQKGGEAPALPSNFSSVHDTNALVISVVDNLEKYVAYVIYSIRENIHKNKTELELIKQKIIQDMQDFEARIHSLLA
jgi:hypothetical protein